MDESGSQRQPAKATRSVFARPLYIAVAAGVLVVGIVAWLVLAQRAKSTVPSDVVSAQQTAAFPLYYPQPMPAGFSAVEGSLRADQGATILNLKDSKGNVVVLTQQPRPRLTEEVTKTKQFKTAAGPAFLADLGGHTVGFIYADKTLIIARPSGDTDNDKLSDLLSSLKRL
jgi:hypothetical protein